MIYVMIIILMLYLVAMKCLFCSFVVLVEGGVGIRDIKYVSQEMYFVRLG